MRGYSDAERRGDTVARGGADIATHREPVPVGYRIGHAVDDFAGFRILQVGDSGKRQQALAVDVLAPPQNRSGVLAARTGCESEIVGGSEAPIPVSRHQKGELPGMVVAIVGKDVENRQREHRPTLPPVAGNRAGQCNQIPVVQGRQAEIGVEQAAGRVYVKALGAVPVEAAGSEIVPAPGAGNEACLRHAHASRSRHLRVGLLDLSRVLRIVHASKLDQVVIVAACRRVGTVDGVSLSVEGHQRFRTRTAGGATDASEFGNHIRRVPGQNPAGVDRQLVKVRRRVGRTPNIRGGRVAEGTHTLIADAGEPVEGRQRRRFDAEFAGAPVDKQSTPAIGQAVVKHPVQTAEYRGVIRSNQPARRAVANGREFKA